MNFRGKWISGRVTFCRLVGGLCTTGGAFCCNRTVRNFSGSKIWDALLSYSSTSDLPGDSR